MTSVLVTLQDAVVSALNGAPEGTFSQSFVAERKRVIEYDRAATEGALKAYVFGLVEGVDPDARGTYEHEYTVKVALYKQVADDAAADAMDYLRQQVIDFLKSANVGDPQLYSLANEPVYDHANLEQFNTFVSVITLTYRLPR